MAVYVAYAHYAPTLANYAGIKPSSVASILKFAGPLVLGYLGKNLAPGSRNVSGLSSLLLGQRDGIMNAIPGALRGVLAGIGAPAARAAQIVDTKTKDVAYAARAQGAYDSAPETARSVSPLMWMLPILLAGVVAWGLLSFLRSRPGVSDVNAGQMIGTTGMEYVTKTLGGIQLRYPSMGLESRLISYIDDPGVSVSKETWFDFDRLLFETDSARLKPESREQLNTLASLRKAYPRVNTKIGGYTDNTGDPGAITCWSTRRRCS
jgi:OmpA-OmpF porin, OOP family